MKNRNWTKFNFILGLYLFTWNASVQGDVDCWSFIDGSPGEGYIESPNYPFDYDNNQNCTTTIAISEDEFEPGTKKICFKFRRFKLDETRQDHLVLKNTNFYGNGSSSNPAYESIWDVICDETEKKEDDQYYTVEIPFVSDPQFVNPGFQAEFEILPINVDVIAEPDCNKNEWRCLNGSCLSAEKVCDGIKDCSSFEDESYAHARCTEGFISGIVACDYSRQNDQTCITLSNWNPGWKKETTSINALYGPSKDHTGGDTTGFYMRTQFTWNGLKTFDYQVKVWTTPHQGVHCLSFWYHMKGKDPGKLKVYWGITGGNGIPPWSRKGNHGDKWHRGQLERSDFSKNANPTFQVSRGGEIDSQIALDDISILKGPCHNIGDISCNFEGSFCGWTITEGNWVLESAEDSPNGRPPTDSSSGGSQGSYIRLETNSGTITYSGKIRSPVLTSPYSTACLSFFVYADGENPEYATLYVDQVFSGGRGISSEYIFDTDNEWKHLTARVPPAKAPFQIEFYVIMKPEKNIPDKKRILIDEISLIFDSCQNLDLNTCATDEFRCEDKELDMCIPAYLKCNGELNCKDGSDEQDCPNPGKCESYEFLCSNKVCIPQRYVCNGFDDCGDNSDEYDCPETEPPSSVIGSFTVAAIASIIAAIILLVIIIFGKIFMCYYRRHRSQTSMGAAGFFQRRQSNESFNTQPPPTYDQCVDNLAKYPKPQHDDKQEDNELDLPTYDLVQMEQYIQITIPIEDEIRRMKEEMASRNNSLHNSIDGLDDAGDSESEIPGTILVNRINPETPPITGMPALMDDGYFLTHAPRVPQGPIVHRPNGQSYHRTGHVNRAYSGSEGSLETYEDIDIDNIDRQYTDNRHSTA